MGTADELDQLIAQLEAVQTGRAARARRSAIEEQAWEQLRGQLRRMALRTTRREDVDDVVQTVLLKLQSPGALRRLRASRSITGYLAVMLRNAAVDLSRGRREDLGATDERRDEAASASDLISAAERAKRLREATAGLSIADRELLRLRYWEELTIAEIARRYRVRYSTMAVRLFRIVGRLRAELGDDGLDPGW